MTSENFGSAERYAPYDRKNAIRQVGDYAVATSNSLDAGGQAGRAIVDHYTGSEFEGLLESIEASGNSDMLAVTEAFLTDSGLPNATLARQRMEGRWDAVQELEADLGSGVSQVLQQAGYKTTMIDRRSREAELDMYIVPGVIRGRDLVALQRKRVMMRAEHGSLPDLHPRRVLEVDKSSWFVLNIGALHTMSRPAAQEVRSIVINDWLMSLPFDWQGLSAFHHGGSVFTGDLDEFLQPWALPEATERLKRAVAAAAHYHIPDHIIMGRLLDAPYPPNKLWSPLSTYHIDRYIAAASPGAEYDSALFMAHRELLIPAETTYYIADTDAASRERPPELTVDFAQLLHRDPRRSLKK